MTHTSATQRPWTFGMHLYNIAAIVVFTGFVSLHYLVPDLGETTGLSLGDPLLFTLAVPLLLVLAGNSYLSLREPDRGYQQMNIQLAYKPFSIILTWVFVFTGALPAIWAVLLTLALLLYIGGNLMALRERTM